MHGVCETSLGNIGFFPTKCFEPKTLYSDSSSQLTKQHHRFWGVSQTWEKGSVLCRQERAAQQGIGRGRMSWADQCQEVSLTSSRESSG